MYAIFETGGKQYKVSSGDVLRVEKLADAKAGEKYKFDKVLAVSDDKGISVGTPYLEAATVTASVIGDGKKEKVIIFKFKSKKDYRKKQGHRQPYTEIEIETVEIGGKTVIKQAPKKEAPAKEDEQAEEAEEAAEVTEAVSEEKSEAKAEKKPAKKAAPAEEETKEEATETTESVDVPVEAVDVPAKEEAPAPKKSSQTKADISAKLDELGVSYLKSAKKDELLALLAEAEGAEASAEAKAEGVEIE
jgi:large subunit ribosomal protein L21